MPRPKTKEELLLQSQENYQKLITLVDSFSEEEQQKEFSIPTMNRNISDILAHLHHWHLLFIDWHTVGMSGKKPNMPAKGYTWKTTPELNKWIWEKYHGADLNDIKIKLETSYQQVQEIIISYTNEQLFEKKKYHWTGSTSLGSYLISATSSHYDWALKLIKKGKK